MNRLRVILIPTEHEYVLLPQSMLNHIYPFAPPLSLDRASEYVIGGVLIQNEKIPLLNFNFQEFPVDIEDVDTSGFHFILVKTISTQSAYRKYAILSHGEPQLRDITQEDLQTIAPQKNHRYISQYVSLQNSTIDKPIVILNLDELEKEIMMS